MEKWVPVLHVGALTVLHLSLLSINSLNKTDTAVFTPLLHRLLPGDYTTRIYLCIPAAKRAFVIHADNGGAARIACANIIPYGNTSHSEYGFQTVEYTRLVK